MTVILDEHWPETIFEKNEDGIWLTMPDGSRKLVTRDADTVPADQGKQFEPIHESGNRGEDA